jgi:hypothetical protein
MSGDLESAAAGRTPAAVLRCGLAYVEVLEYSTREHPRSAWRDDKATPERERRDEVAARAAQGDPLTRVERPGG